MSAKASGGGVSAEASRGGSGRAFHLGLLAAKVTLSLGLIAFLLSRIPAGRFEQALKSARPDLLMAACGLFFFSNLLAAFQWSRLMRAVEVRIPFWKVLAYYHVGLFFNNFLPANIGGDIARVADAARYGPSKVAALSAVMIDRLIGTVALAGLALITTLPAIDRFHLGLAYAALGGFFAVSVLLLWAVFHPGWLPLAGRVLVAVGLGRFVSRLDDLRGRLGVFRGRPGLFVRMFAVAALTQVSRIGVHALVAKALGLEIALRYFFLFVPLLAVVVSLPISLNGIGVREGAGIVLFGLVGVDRAHAFSLQFLTYVVAVAVSLLGGLVFLARIPRRRAERRNPEGHPWA